MNPLTGTSTDPIPYIVGAYGVGILILFGYTGYLITERLKLRQMLAALKKDKD